MPIRPEAPVIKKKFAKAGAFDSLEELLGNDLICVDVGSIENSYEAGVNSKRLHFSFKFQVSGFKFAAPDMKPETLNLFVIPVSYINKMSRNRSCCGHRRTDQMRQPAASLPPFKVAIAG